MKIRVLGCHGSDQLVGGAAGPVPCGTCGFLLNDSVLLDAGTVGSRLYLHEQRRIQAVLLTHLHFDHIRDLPTLADNLTGEIDEPTPALLAKELHKLGRLEVPVYLMKAGFESRIGTESRRLEISRLSVLVDRQEFFLT
ncbi:MAG: MBL fold metallo-hydrolase [Nitrospiraceae bacterium]